jgi:hypothetical protein
MEEQIRSAVQRWTEQDEPSRWPRSMNYAIKRLRGKRQELLKTFKDLVRRGDIIRDDEDHYRAPLTAAERVERVKVFFETDSESQEYRIEAYMVNPGPSFRGARPPQEKLQG